MCAVLYFEEEKYDEVYEKTGGKRCCGYGCSNIGCNICVFCICLTYENDAIVSTDKGPYTAYLCIQAGADKRSVTNDYPNAVEKEKNSKVSAAQMQPSQVTARIP